MKIVLSKITFSFQILFELELKLLLFCQFPHVSNQGDWKMCLIKIVLSKITYSFQILFKLELKLILFCRFPHVTKEIERCAKSKLDCLK